VTYYRWRQEFGGLKIEQVKRLKELELENTRDPRCNCHCGRAGDGHAERKQNEVMCLCDCLG
jgi:hypothetical protein